MLAPKKGPIRDKITAVGPFIIFVILFLAIPISGAQKDLVFEDDFSADQGWARSTSDLFRDSTENNVHFHTDRGYIQKMYHVIDPLEGDFELSVDVNLEKTNANGFIYIGLTDDINNIDWYWEGVGLIIGKYAGSYFAQIGAKYSDGTQYFGMSNDKNMDIYAGKWYTYKIIKNGRNWKLERYDNNNILLETQTGEFTGSFSPFNYVLFGNGDANQWETADGKIDNLELFYEKLPEESKSAISMSETAEYGVMLSVREKFPDLIITSDNINLLGPTFQNSQMLKYSIKAEIINEGESVANNIIISYFMGDPDRGGKIIKSDTYPKLSPGESTGDHLDVVEFPIEAGGPKDNYFYVLVNCDEPELRLNNNKAYKMVISNYLEEGFPTLCQYDYGGNDACGPVASACVLAYWDDHGYDKLVDNGDITALVEDLKKAQAYYLPLVRGTFTILVEWGIEEVCNNEDYGNCYQFDSYGALLTSSLWNDVKEEIDAGRPFIYYHSSYYSHYYPVFGYTVEQTTDSKKRLIVCDLKESHYTKFRWDSAESDDRLIRIVPGRGEKGKQQESSEDGTTIQPIDMPEIVDLTSEITLSDEIDDLILDLESEQSDVRICAAVDLGEIGDPKAVDPLIEALKDEDSDVRMYVAWALGEIGDQRAVDPLILALEDPNGDVREYAAWALGEIGDAIAVDPLIRALEDEDWWVRMNAAEALGKIGDVRAVEPLIEVLDDEETGVGDLACQALGEIADPGAVDPLIVALKDEHAYVRVFAASVLGHIGDARAVSPLIEALEDDDWGVRRVAAWSLVLCNKSFKYYYVPYN